jgi:hypothetical protein
LTVGSRSLQMAHNRCRVQRRPSRQRVQAAYRCTFRFSAPRWCSWGSSEETRQRRALVVERSAEPPPGPSGRRPCRPHEVVDAALNV